MKNKWVGALVAATLVAFVASACSSKARDFGTGTDAGGQSADGKSGSGPDELGGTHARGGDQASAGMGGGVQVVGGGPGGAGAPGGEGGACQGADCAPCAGAGSTPNVCGGCTAIAGTLGAPCGACLVTACSADKNSLECKSQCTPAQVCLSGLNQCKTPDCSAPDSCGLSDKAGGTCTNAKGNCPAKPNTNAPSCSGSSCAYVCSKKTLSCSTSANPKCGSWNFESNSTEGWYVNVKSDAVDGTVAGGAVRVTTPPGPGTGIGSYSLALTVDGTKANASFITISLDLCDGGFATGIQTKIHASVYFKASDNKGQLSGPGYAQFDGGTTVVGPDVNTPADMWFDVPSNAVSGTSVKRVDLSISGITNHKGVLYFDNIYFD